MVPVDYQATIVVTLTSSSILFSVHVWIPSIGSDSISKKIYANWDGYEVKNPEKQKSGRLGQKKLFAAVSAAPKVKEIILDTDGRSSDQDLSNLPNTSAADDSLAAAGVRMMNHWSTDPRGK